MSFLDNIDKIISGTELESTLEPTVQEEPQPIVEEPKAVEEPVVEEPEVAQEAPEIELPEIKVEPVVDVDPSEYLYNKWKDDLGDMSLTDFKKQFQAQIDVVGELLKEVTSLKKEKVELDTNPLIRQAKIAKEINELWAAKKDSWEQELAEVIPEEYKAISKLGKKEQKEVLKLIEEESAKYLTSRKVQNLEIGNPLLAVAPKLVKRFAKPKEEPTPPQTLKPDLNQQKKLSSLNTSASPSEKTEEPKKFHPSITSAGVEHLNKLDKLFEGI